MGCTAVRATKGGADGPRVRFPIVRMETCRACAEEHQFCLDHWATLSDYDARGTTFHGPEAHHREPHQESSGRLV